MTMIQPLPVARYRFTCQLDQPLRLPAYAGSMLRGAFGVALRKLSCMTKARQCDGCMLAATCPYRRIFNPLAPPGLSMPMGSVPAPYVIEPVTGSPAGPVTQLTFNMVLFGQARFELALVVLAWERALAHGLGKGRVAGAVQSVTMEQPDGQWLPVYQQGGGSLAPHEPVRAYPDPTQYGGCTLRFVTPLRLQQNGKALAAARLRPRTLVAALLRRISLLHEVHHQPLALPVAELLQVAEGLEQRMQLHWRDWTRYSSRQQQKMTLGGLVGDWHWQGELTDLWPWLWAGQFLHVGKEAVFGLGQYQLLAD